jgi:hypothetical protein
MKLIADRLLLSRACFLLGFTIIKLNKMKN